MAAMILPGAAPAVLRFHRRSNGPFWADWDGTVMEQRGRNRWQTFGSPKGRKWLDLAPNRCHWLPPVAVWIDGKEGVDGSSPSEGFTTFLLVSSFRLPRRRRVGASTST